ncbi:MULTISPECIES: Fe2+-dependent dioxygenase [Cupriavidus]
MILHIPGVLNAEEVRTLRDRLVSGEWVDGRATVGTAGAKVKHNRQAPTNAPASIEMAGIVTEALKKSGLFFSAALPLRIAQPQFNRYDSENLEHYGFHVDGAVRAHEQSPGWLRTDLSATLFLCDPDEYDGGDLTIRDTYGVHEVKLPAGDMVLYPSTSVHCVTPVTRGSRLCAFFWMQSMIRNDGRRTMLYELDQAIQSLRARCGESEELLTLTHHYHNLLREWSEI